MAKKETKADRIRKIKRLIDAGKLVEGLKLTNADDAKALLNIGVTYGKKKSHDIAEKIFSHIVQLNPNYDKAWSNKGIALGKLERYDEALTCYEEAISINPNFDNAWLNKGIALGKLERYDEALTCFEEAIRINPNFDNAWSNKGIDLGKLGRYDEALTCYDEAIRINPNNEHAWSSKGIALGKLGRNDEALTCYDEAIRINPNSDKAWFYKGNAQGRQGRYEEALACYEEAIRINPNYAKAWDVKGSRLGSLGRHDEALTCHDEAIRINPNYKNAWYNKGVALGKLGRYNEAVSCHDEAIRINPNLAEAWTNKGVALSNLRRIDEALTCFEEAIRINPNLAEAWSNKGVSLGNQGRIDEEVTCYDEAIRINPNLAEAHGNKGILFLIKHDYQAAADQFRISKKLFTDKGVQDEIERSHRLDLLAKNASKLMSSLKPIDEKFTQSLSSNGLKELKNKSLEVNKEISKVVKRFEKIDLPKDAMQLLKSKAMCFTALSDSLDFKKVDLRPLRKSEKVFVSWNLNTFADAVHFLIAFIEALRKRYNSIDEINEISERQLLQALKTSFVLNGELSEEILKGKPFKAKPASSGIDDGPKIIYKHIADTEKTWVKFCLVQLKYSLKYAAKTKEFGLAIEENGKDTVRKKVFQALKIASERGVDITVFSELSFDNSWVNEIQEKFKNMIIIGGSYYDDTYNVCPIFIDGTLISPPYRKIKPSPTENPESTGRGMKSGNILYIFQTKCGRFSVLTCSDYIPIHVYEICNYETQGVKGVDFIINPMCETSPSERQSVCNSDCTSYNMDIVQVNKAEDDSKYGKSCLIGREHNTILEKLKGDEFRHDDNIKYKLFELEGEMMMISELNVSMKSPPVDPSADYSGRIRVSDANRFVYKKSRWVNP